MEVKIYIEGNYIDLYKDEGINFKSTVQDINDISKVFADFTKDFNVPASKENNEVFKHYYESDIFNGFDARTKKDGQIFLNDILYSKGKFRLTGTSLKDNEIESYKIQFEGDVIKVKDVIGDDKLSSLDLSAYDHEYSSANVKTGLTSSLSSGAIVYPMISHTRRFLYDSDNGTTSNDTQVNIHYDVAKDNDAIDYTDLKPAIKVSALIDAIQSKYNLDFVGDFFNRDYYTSLYMWLNNIEGNLNTISTSQNNLINWDSGSDEWVDLATDVFTTDVNTTSGDAFFNRMITTTVINISAGFEDVEYSFVITENDDEVFRRDGIKGGLVQHYIFRADSNGKEIKFFVNSNNLIEYNSELKIIKRTYEVFPTSTTQSETTYASQQLIPSTVTVSNQLPELKTFEFLQGILRMFNIALTANFDGSINWETLPDWYAVGNVHKNFEQYVDIDKASINRGVLKNEFKLSYEKPETILASQFKANTGVSYGDLEAKLYDENNVLLDGTKLEIKVPFENMIFERPTDINTNALTNFQYGYAVDKEQSPIVTKPILFYNINTPITDIGFKNDDDTHEEINTFINTPNQCLSLEDNNVSNINFGAELSTYNYGIQNVSLYNQFYKDYVTDMFSNQRRVYLYDAIIPAHVLTEIKLNDRLIIGNKRYIINSINTNLVTQKTKLELLNDIYTAGDLIGNNFVISPSFANLDKNGGVFSFTIYYNGTTTVTEIDTGDGIFATESSDASATGTKSVQYTVSLNNTGSERTQIIRVDNGTETLDFTIIQASEVIDWSITTKRFDNNIITFDNSNI